MKKALIILTLFVPYILFGQSKCNIPGKGKYENIPGVYPIIGEGYNLVEPEKHYYIPFDRSSFEKDSAEINSTSFDYTLVTNSNALRKSLNIDASVDVSNLAYSGGMQINYDNKSFTSTNNLVFIIHFTKTFKRYFLISPPTLKAESENQLKNNKVQFSNSYGYEYVNEVTKGIDCHIIITMKNVTSTSYNSLFADLDFAYDGLASSVEANVNFRQIVETSFQNRNIEITIISAGATGEFDELGNLIISASKPEFTFDSLSYTVAQYFKRFSVQTAPVSKFKTATYEEYGYCNNGEIAWTKGIYDTLIVITNKYFALQGLKDEILRAKDQNYYLAKYLTQDYYKKLDSVYLDIGSKQSELLKVMITYKDELAGRKFNLQDWEFDYRSLIPRMWAIQIGDKIAPDGGTEFGDRLAATYLDNKFNDLLFYQINGSYFIYNPNANKFIKSYDEVLSELPAIKNKVLAMTQRDVNLGITPDNIDQKVQVIDMGQLCKTLNFNPNPVNHDGWAGRKDHHWIEYNCN